MRAIQTEYDGFIFRSRVEARWAVFFHEAGLRYEYEKQGFKLNGTGYLPDFWLPEPRWWIEVKGGPPNGKERDLARWLTRESGCNTYIFCGSPATVEHGSFPVWSYPALGESTQNERGQMVLQDLAGILAWLELGVWVAPTDPDQAQRARSIEYEWVGTFHYALDAARKARFEHGQQGAPRKWARSYQLSAA
jgi:hypothetical protein